MQSQIQSQEHTLTDLPLFPVHGSNDLDCLQLYDGSHGPEDNTRTILEILSEISGFLTDKPTLLSAAFDHRYTRANFNAYAQSVLPLDLFRVDVRNNFVPRPDLQWYTDEEFQEINNPLQAQAFANSLARAPRIRYMGPNWPAKVHSHCNAPVKRCFCAHTPQNYVRRPVSGEVIQQLCVVEWESVKHRASVMKQHPKWWSHTIDAQINRAEKEGIISHVEHWEAVLEKWEPEKDAVEVAEKQWPRICRSVNNLFR